MESLCADRDSPYIGKKSSFSLPLREYIFFSFQCDYGIRMAHTHTAAKMMVMAAAAEGESRIRSFFIIRSAIVPRS